jgi:hypothetical protein
MVMRRVRQIHLWLGVLFSPLIIFFACTGMLQTFNFHESEKNGSYKAPAWIVKMAQVHKNQRLARGPGAPSPLPLKVFVVLMGFGLIVSSLLGICMAFKYQRNRWLVGGMIVAGIILPLVLLFL